MVSLGTDTTAACWSRTSPSSRPAVTTAVAEAGSLYRFSPSAVARSPRICMVTVSATMGTQG